MSAISPGSESVSWSSYWTDRSCQNYQVYICSLWSLTGSLKSHWRSGHRKRSRTSTWAETKKAVWQFEKYGEARSAFGRCCSETISAVPAKKCEHFDNEYFQTHLITCGCSLLKSKLDATLDVSSCLHGVAREKKNTWMTVTKTKGAGRLCFFLPQ